MRNKRGGGFSLVELLVVMAILAICSALAAPSMGRWIDGYRANTAARQLMTDLQFARMNAVSKKVQYRLAFTDHSYTIQHGDLPVGSASWTQEGIARNLGDPANPYFSKGTTLGGTLLNGAVFSPMGNAQGGSGTATVSSGSATRSVIVHPFCGRVRIE